MNNLAVFCDLLSFFPARAKLVLCPFSYFVVIVHFISSSTVFRTQIVIVSTTVAVSVYMI